MSSLCWWAVLSTSAKALHPEFPGQPLIRQPDERQWAASLPKLDPVEDVAAARLHQFDRKT